MSQQHAVHRLDDLLVVAQCCVEFYHFSAVTRSLLSARAATSSTT
jgi:hypothetical protein